MPSELQEIRILNTITAQQNALRRADPLDLVECEGCGFEKRYARAVRPGPDDGPSVVCPRCTALDSVYCGECGDPMKKDDPHASRGLCTECVAFITHYDCKDHPCADCASNAIDAAEALEDR